MTFSQTIRFDGAYARGDNDMDIGSLDWENLDAEHLNVFWESVIKGVEGEEPPPPPEHGEEPFIDALQRKGKSKGKGKRMGPMSQAFSQGKGDQQQQRPPNPLTAAPPPGQKDKRICHYCGKAGHVLANC